jgi:hypothetical protein
MWLLLALACTPDEDPAKTRRADPSDDTGARDTGDPDDDTDEGDGCRATRDDWDYDRPVLVSLPYDEDANSADTWAVLTLDRDGELVDDNTRITMGRATSGRVTFTPDGTLALAATERGDVAIYDTVSGTVVESAWNDGFYAGRVVVEASGEVAWIVDGNWANNGGGLYRVTLDCATGAPGPAERVVEGKLPADLVWTDAGGLVAALDLPGAAEGDDLALFDFTSETPSFVAGVDAFGDDDAIVSDVAVAGGWAVVGDINEFSGYPTRVARVNLSDMTAETTVDIEDPISMVPFPDGSARVLVASGYGDALLVLDIETGNTSTVSASRVQLPGALAAVKRGPLAGRVLGSEVGGVRMVDLGDSVTDLGVTSLGSGLGSLPGAIGVAP